MSSVTVLWYLTADSDGPAPSLENFTSKSRASDAL